MSDSKFVETPYPLLFANRRGELRNRRTHPNNKEIPKLYEDKDGYYRIWWPVDGKNKFIPVHRIIALTFHHRPSPDLVVNHKDRDRKNNHADNLEWITAADNERHARRNGKVLLGSKASQSKLTEDDVLKIVQMGHSMMQKDIAEFFCVNAASIGKILRGDTWGHLTGIKRRDHVG